MDIVVANHDTDYLAVLVGDIDGNGYLDLLTPNPDEVGTAFNMGKGELRFERGSPMAAKTPFAVEVGWDDQVVADDGTPRALLYLGLALSTER